MRSSQPVSTSARQHRAVLYNKGLKKRELLTQSRQVRRLTLAVAGLLSFVICGGLISLKLYPHPREGDISVDGGRGASSGRKDLGIVGTPAGASGLYALLEGLEDTDGQRLELTDVRGRVLLIANVASQCGYTASNYETFRDLLFKYHADGLRVIAVPCSDFGNQEFTDDGDIRRFVRERYDQSTAPITLLRRMDDDIGQNALFNWLRSHTNTPGGDSPVSWNFNKWLIDRRGEVRQRYDSADHREDLERDISALL